MRESRAAGSVVSGAAAYHRCTSFVAPPGALSPCEGPLAAVQTVLYLVVFLFLLALIVRIAFDWIQFFSREWRPRGPVLVFAEGTKGIRLTKAWAVARVYAAAAGVEKEAAFAALFVEEPEGRLALR